jgi:hypothetical protein
MRLVVDTNIFISAALKQGSLPNIARIPACRAMIGGARAPKPPDPDNSQRPNSPSLISSEKQHRRTASETQGDQSNAGDNKIG